MTEQTYTHGFARYAKGQVAVRPSRDGSGWKGRIDRLCEALNARWSGREGAYIMSWTKARKLELLVAAGWDAGYFGRRFYAPGGIAGQEGKTLADAMRALVCKK